MIPARFAILATALAASLTLGGCASGSYVGAGIGANPLPHYAANTAAPRPPASHGQAGT